MNRFRMRFIVLPVIVFLMAGWKIGGATEQPQKVYRIIYVQKPLSWYQEQEKLWHQVVQKEPHNSQAWYNYFLAVRYGHRLDPWKIQKQRLDSLLNVMEQYIPDSYEFVYLKFFHTNSYRKPDSALLEKLKSMYRAYPRRPEAIYELINYYERYGNFEEVAKYCQALYKTEDISSGLLNYNYNVLASTDSNAILFTNGDNDTYPAWVLQYAREIRPDVLVLNLSLMRLKGYLERKLKAHHLSLPLEKLPKPWSRDFLLQFVNMLHETYPERPLYFALTVNRNLIKPFQDDLYIVGMAYRYSPQRIDNLAYLRRNFNRRLRLDYLWYDWYDERFLQTPSVRRLNLNYVVPLVQLAVHCHESGEENMAHYWFRLAEMLAQKANKKEWLEYIRHAARTGQITSP